MKSNLKGIVIKNAVVGFLSQLAMVVLQLVSRSMVIKYVGIETLGITSTFSSILGMLSLADSGIQTAIIFYLYKPLAEKDEKEMNKIMNLIRYIYHCIGIFFLIVSAILLPFSGKFLNGVTMNPGIYLLFLLQSLTTSITYFLAYKRAIFIADQRGYICKFVDTAANIFFSIIRIMIVIKTHSYHLYLCITILQTITGNSMIHFIYNKRFPDFRKEKADKEQFYKLLKDARNLFGGQFAAYVYSGSDNIIISKFINTLTVGLFANYTIITVNIKNLVNSLFHAMGPMFGNMIACKTAGTEQKKEMLDFTAHLMYLVSMVTLIPQFALIQDFIGYIWGEQRLLPNSILFLLLVDQYFTLIQDPLGCYIIASGLFKESKIADMSAAILNLLLSIALIGGMGLKGVLLGTVVSRFLQWLIKSTVVFIICFQKNHVSFIGYWIRNIIKALIFFTTAFIMSIFYQHMPINNFWVRFLTGGVICEVFILVIFIGLIPIFKEQKKLLIFIKR